MNVQNVTFAFQIWMYLAHAVTVLHVPGVKFTYVRRVVLR